jgi:hypothetical protein
VHRSTQLWDSIRSRKNRTVEKDKLAIAHFSQIFFKRYFLANITFSVYHDINPDTVDSKTTI